jgi:hypothetical protein
MRRNLGISRLDARRYMYDACKAEVLEIRV